MSVNREVKKITVPQIVKMKELGQKISMLTAYDALMAEILDDSGIDIVLVGDSGGMVVSGYDSTLPVTMDEMIWYAKAVRRGVKRALLVADMPFMSYQKSVESAIGNAGRFLQEAGAEAVKIEGGKAVCPLIEQLTSYGIPVMGHIGLTPQSVHQFGGYGVRGKDKEIAKRLLEDAKALEDSGVFCLVLEKIPAQLAQEITNKINIPTIGIGAGVNCDGQVLVTHDMLGMFDKFQPKFVRRYAQMRSAMGDAFKKYVEDVKNKNFPDDNESY
jgi:3-methyl-2-oxobutanoate hydroxymethyltransferase